MPVNLNKFRDKTVLVIGDVMLDSYLWGDVSRISPEAPVPVVRLKERSEVLGGAGNVVSNLSGLGCRVVFAGICGNDEKGRKLNTLLEEKGIETFLFEDEGRPTIPKSDFISIINVLKVGKAFLSPDNVPVSALHIPMHLCTYELGQLEDIVLSMSIYKLVNASNFEDSIDELGALASLLLGRNDEKKIREIKTLFQKLENDKYIFYKNKSWMKFRK